MRIAVEMAMDTLDGPRAWSLSQTSMLDSLEEALWRFFFDRSVGTPDEVYTKPVNEFVADFIRYYDVQRGLAKI